MPDQMSKMGMSLSFSLISLLSLLISLCSATDNTTFQVGVILDLDSPVGRIGLTSLSLAISDFYSVNRNYATKLVLNVRDSKRLVTEAAATALSLLNDVEVDAIIGPQRSDQANFVISLGDKAKVPIVSFSATSPSLHPRTPYFVQTAPSDADQVDAIASIVGNFHWNQVVQIYEDSDYGQGIIPYLSNALQVVNTRVAYRSVIPLSATDDFLLQELYKMKTMQTRVFVVHLSVSLASKLFPKAKEAGMMSEGYAWIVTSGLMDLFYSLDSRVVEAMQGVIGVNPLFPKSANFNSTSERWKKKFLHDNPGKSRAELSLFGAWAYDTLWALAMTAERVGFRAPPFGNTSSLNSTNLFTTKVSQTGPKLLEEMLENTFDGLLGKFHLVDGQLKTTSFQILNVVGKEEIEVGVWTNYDQKSPSESNVNFAISTKDLRWPGESAVVPKGWEIPLSGEKLRIGVPVKAGFEEFVKVERDPQTNANKVTGFCIDVFDSVMKQLPYAVRYEYIPFETGDGSSKGSHNNLSYYDNLTYNVLLGVFDAAVGDVTITAKRSEFVDFTLPFEAGGITLTAPIANYDPNEEWIFLKPFTPGLWLTAMALLILIGVSLWILEHRINTGFRGPPSEHAGMIFYFPFMSIVYAQRERVVSNLSRLVVVVWMLVVVVLNSTYTASLSARITVQKLESSVRDAKQLMRDGDYVGCRQGSFVIDYLKSKGFNESKILRYKSHDEIREALKRTSKNGGISAFFSLAPHAELFLSKYCDEYMTVGPNFPTEGLAFVFPKGSPLVADVSRAVIKVIENGQQSIFEKQWLKNQECEIQYVTYKSNADMTQMSLKSFGILFEITGGITLVCVLRFLFTYHRDNRVSIRNIWNADATLRSRLGKILRHFDERDPNYFPENEPGNPLGNPGNPPGNPGNNPVNPPGNPAGNPPGNPPGNPGNLPGNPGNAAGNPPGNPPGNPGNPPGNPGNPAGNPGNL